MQNFQEMHQNDIQGAEIQAFVNSPAVIKAKAVAGVVKGLMAAGICGFAFISPIFEGFEKTQDDMFLMFSKGMKALLILFIIMGVLMFLRNLLTLILILTGNNGEGAGHKYIVLMGILEANAGRVFQIIFGGIFVGTAFFSFTQGPDMLAEGTTVESLYIVSGIFALAGLGLIIGAIVGIVKSFKNYISGGAAY